MKIIISPAKEQKEIPFNFVPTQPIYTKKVDLLIRHLKKLSVKQLQKAFKCSEDIAKNVHSYYQNFNFVTHPALFLFNGLQYKNIDVSSLSDEQIHFLLENLFIADALYGILRSSDEISHYRLDYKTKLPFFDYNYYKKELDEFIDEPIINLCSKEYSKNLNQEKLFTIDFVQKVKGNVKSFSTHTKIARGKFIRYLAQNMSTSISTIKEFNEDGYYLKYESERGLTFQKDFS